MFKNLIIALASLTVVLTGTVNAADPSLVGWWKLDEGSGTTAIDSSGHGNNGTLQDTATFTTEGHLRGAVQLDGAGDYIDCGSSSVFNVGNAVTLAAWVWADPGFSYPDWSGIIMRGGPNIDTFALYYNRRTDGVDGHGRQRGLGDVRQRMASRSRNVRRQDEDDLSRRLVRDHGRRIGPDRIQQRPAAPGRRTRRDTDYTLARRPA
jgi:hypothetical protein